MDGWVERGSKTWFEGLLSTVKNLLFNTSSLSESIKLITREGNKVAAFPRIKLKKNIYFMCLL
jgi:hypothetical protein